jgi:long-chain acyl-CoA synthetase
MNIAADLDQVAATRSGHPVIIASDDSRWTFADLDLRASRVATGLEAAGVVPGDRVAIVMGNLPEHVASWYGILKAGAVPVDLNILLADEEWRYILSDCRPAAAICGPEFSKRVSVLAQDLDPAPPVFAARGGEGAAPLDELGAGTARRDAVDRDDSDLAVIAYTSGTTGFPKGVMHTHGLLRLQLDLLRDHLFRATPDDVIAAVLPLFPLHANLCQAACAVHVGCSLLLLERFDPAALAQASRRHRITAGTFAPSMLIAMLQMPQEERPAFPGGRCFFVGGAPLHPEVRDRFERDFGIMTLQGFGSTEVMGAVAMEQPERRAPWGSCGELQPGAAGLVRVIDDDGNDVPAGEVGEFAVHRDRATMGYWGNPGLTEEAFLDGTWFHMGDLGRIDENGFVFLLDRKKDMIIRGGFNIYSAELERVLNEHEAVAEATVIGIPHDRLGEVPKAIIVLRPSHEGSDALAKELVAVCAKRLGKMKVPEEIEFVGFADLPRNAMGKVLKRELRSRANP